MKIIEVIEQYTTKRGERQRDQPYSYDYLRKLSREKNDDDNSSGWYSRAVPHPRDPHTFIKSTKYTSYLNDDAFHKYIEMVVNLHKKGIDNPYFPAVYEIKITRDNEKKTRPQYHLQALQKPQLYDVEALKGMAERMFHDPERIADSQHSDVVWSSICSAVKYAVQDNDVKPIKDTELLQAVKYIRALKRTNPDWDLDMHSNNFMIRGTSVGPQLVITDPVSDAGRSIPNQYDFNRDKELAQKKLAKAQGGAAQKLYKVIVYDPNKEGYILGGEFYAANDRHAEDKHTRLRHAGKLKIPTYPHSNQMWDSLVYPAEQADRFLAKLGVEPSPKPFPKKQDFGPALRMGSGGTGLSKKPSWFDDLS